LGSSLHLKSSNFFPSSRKLTSIETGFSTQMKPSRTFSQRNFLPKTSKLFGLFVSSIFVYNCKFSLPVCYSRSLPSFVLVLVLDSSHSQLADLDHDTRLNPEEFCVALHLIRTCILHKKASLPSTLPASLNYLLSQVDKDNKQRKGELFCDLLIGCCPRAALFCFFCSSQTARSRSPPSSSVAVPGSRQQTRRNASERQLEFLCLMAVCAMFCVFLSVVLLCSASSARPAAESDAATGKAAAPSPSPSLSKQQAAEVAAASQKQLAEEIDATSKQIGLRRH
jgi:hypothetical protein